MYTNSIHRDDESRFHPNFLVLNQASLLIDSCAPFLMNHDMDSTSPYSLRHFIIKKLTVNILLIFHYSTDNCLKSQVKTAIHATFDPYLFLALMSPMPPSDLGIFCFLNESLHILP